MRDYAANLAKVPASVTFGLVPSHPCRSVNGTGSQGKYANEG
jgi:hypothetical protein